MRGFYSPRDGDRDFVFSPRIGNHDRCYGAAEGEYSSMVMDWGTFIPMWFVNQEYTKNKQEVPPIVLITPSREIPWENLIDVGKIINQVKIILLLYKESKQLIKKGFIIDDIKNLTIINDILRISHTIPNEKFNDIMKIKYELLKEIDSIKYLYGDQHQRLV